MKLADLRRIAIRQQWKIRFRLRNGMECTVTERGVAQVAGLNRVPDFNLDEELEFAPEFLLDPAGGTERGGQRLSRERMAALCAAPRAAGAGREAE